MKSIAQGITALVIKAVVIAIAGPVKKKSGLAYQVQILLETILIHLQEVVINHLPARFGPIRS
jgi:hypothetical protein